MYNIHVYVLPTIYISAAHMCSQRPSFIPAVDVKEVSLACHYRVASPQSSVGFPEAERNGKNGSTYVFYVIGNI